MLHDWNKYMHWGNSWFTTPIFGLGISLLVIWGVFWKGLALWRSAKDDQKYWFIALLLLQTWGLAEIIYLFFFAKSKLTFTSPPPKEIQKIIY